MPNRPTPPHPPALTPSFLPPSLPPSPSVGILATLVDARGMVLVPEFYAEVEVGLEGGREGEREGEREGGGAPLEMYNSSFTHVLLPPSPLPPSFLPSLVLSQEVSQEELELFDAMNLNIDAYKASLGREGGGEGGREGGDEGLPFQNAREKSVGCI